MSKYRNCLLKQQPIEAIQPKNENRQANINEHVNNTKKHLQVISIQKKQTQITKSQQPKISLQKVSLVFSRIHNSFNLKFQTLCLSIELYAKCCKQKENPQQSSIPSGYLMLICMYLAMKYEQIYHPRLKNLAPLIPAKLNLEEYMLYEGMVLIKLGLNLNVKTARSHLEQVFHDCDKETYLFAYYLLQIAFQDSTIVSVFSTEVICKSIFYSMLPLKVAKKSMKQFKGVPMSDINQCSKLLIQRKCKHTQAESTIFKKYCQEKYLKVAQKPFFQISKANVE